MTRKLLLTVLLAFCCSAVYAETKTPSPQQTAQRAKMKACNAEAKEKALKGDERKVFMSECLKKKPAS